MMFYGHLGGLSMLVRCYTFLFDSAVDVGGSAVFCGLQAFKS